jgi:phenylalanyl-tRNA synthetase beta chain
MPQATEVLRRNVAAALTGLGFYETVTFSFVRPGDAAEFMVPGMSRLDIDDERRGEEPTLRPSVIPSLLRCRRANQDGQVEQPGGVRLFEVASVFAQAAKGPHVENRNLALVMDVTGAGRKRTSDDVQRAMRGLRGTIDQVVSAAGLSPAGVRAVPMSDDAMAHPACDAGASAGLMLGDVALGYMALLSPAAQKKFDLDGAVVYAEIGMGVLEGATPAVREVRALPAFPAIDRDLSIVVEERVRWAQVEAIVREARPAMFESLRYVTTFRDAERVGAGRKSLSLRVRFRAADRTLRSEEADAPITDLVARFGRELGATLRS